MLLSEATTTGFFYLAPWLVFAPVIGLLINAFFTGRMSEKFIGWLASLARLLSQYCWPTRCLFIRKQSLFRWLNGSISGI